MATCTAFIEPLNLRCLFVNTLAGSTDIFIALCFIVFSSMAAFFKMPNTVFFSLLGIFMVMVYAFLDVSALFLIFILIGAFALQRILSTIVK